MKMKKLIYRTSVEYDVIILERNIKHQCIEGGIIFCDGALFYLPAINEIVFGIEFSKDKIDAYKDQDSIVLGEY